MTTVSIIGNGNMGSAIGGIVAAAGHTVEYVNRDTADINGEIVVLAVAHPSVAEILETRGEQLAGKIVVDITNPLNFETFDSLVTPADSSKAGEIAAALPNSRVLKAFNTNFAATLASKQVGLSGTERRAGRCRGVRPPRTSRPRAADRTAARGRRPSPWGSRNNRRRRCRCRSR